MSIERVREFLDSGKPGFMKLMGFRLGDYSADKVEGFVEVRPDLSNRGGVMHGGAIMAMADTLGGAGTIANLARGRAHGDN